MIHLGSVPASTVIYIPFATYGATSGQSITCSGLAVTDIEIYKNGSTTQRASDAGYTLLDTDGIDFDTITGLHGFSIDLADNTDAGFFTVGSWYWVVVSAITVDSQTVTFLAATFRIAPAEGIAGYPKSDVHALLGSAWLTPAVAGTPDVNTKTITAGAVNAAAIGTDAIDADSLKADAVTEIQSGLATASQINSLAINTRANLHVPVEIETPDAGTLVYKIRLHLFDVEGNMEVPDSMPTIALTNAAGVDRSARLSVASNPSAGVYVWDYTATLNDAEEQLVWVFTVVEGTLPRTYPATSYVVEKSAYRFSSADRATLNAAATQASVNAEAVKTTAIKTKTDQLAFTVANQVDANALTGGGGAGSESALMQSTTIATVTSQTVLILTAGSADDDAYNNQLVVITDSVTAVQKARCLVLDYVGLTKTLTLAAAPGFIVTAGDSIKIIAIGGDAQQATVAATALALAGTKVTVTSRVAGSTITAYMGDDFRVRSSTQLSLTVTDTAGALRDKLVAIGLANLYFGASRAHAAAGEITGTIASITYASNVTTIKVEITACAAALQPDNFLYQIQSTQTQGSEKDDYVELEGTLIVKQRTVAARG